LCRLQLRPKGKIYFADGFEINFNHPYGGGKTSIEATSPSNYSGEANPSSPKGHTAKSTVVFKKN